MVNPDTQNERKNYLSKYDVNRHCYRRDKTHYIYQEWVETSRGKGYYIDHIFTVGEYGITLELLDVLQDADDKEAQESENAEKYEEPFNYDEDDAEDNYDDNDTRCVGEKDPYNPALLYEGSPEFIGPEAVLFAENESDESGSSFL